MVKKPEVLMPYSNLKHNLGKVLMQEGWIRDIIIKEEGSLKNLLVILRYTKDGQPVINGIKRVSKPGQRIYTKNTEIPRVMGGIGTTIVSTSKGLMTDKTARTSKVGGEVICQVW